MNLLLVCVLMISAVVVFTEAKDRRLSSELGVIHQARGTFSLNDLIVCDLVNVCWHSLGGRHWSHLARRAGCCRLTLSLDALSDAIRCRTVLRRIDIDNVLGRRLGLKFKLFSSFLHLTRYDSGIHSYH